MFTNKISLILLLNFTLLVVLAYAEPPRYRTSRRNGALRTNIRFLARQEAENEAEVPAPPPAAPASNSPAPYPAAGITPETPFELPTETTAAPPAIAPEQAYGPPEQTYGPPEQTYGPPATADEPVEPDNLYGAPDNAAQPGPVEPISNVANQNIIQPRGRALRLNVVPVPPELAPRAGLVEIIRSEPILVYTLKK